MFGFFSRKPQTEPDPVQLRTPSPSIGSVSNGKANSISPTRATTSFSPHPGPPMSPSPSPPDAESLHALIQSIPPKILHEYMLSHLIAPPVAPETMMHLLAFFSALAPPAKLHCVRCHKDYFEVENTDRSCLVPHDDDSAEVERAGANKGYETLWGCCGKTVEGDGDMGPPDGWCYEGKHTTDTKRARFRDDSDLNDDKLVSCERMRCNEAPPSPGSSASSVTSSPRSRKRTRRRQPVKEKQEEVGEDEEGEAEQDDADEVRSIVSSSSKGKRKAPAPPAKPPRKKRARKSVEDSSYRPVKDEEPEEDSDVQMEDATTRPKKRRPKSAIKDNQIEAQKEKKAPTKKPSVSFSPTATTVSSASVKGTAKTKGDEQASVSSKPSSSKVASKAPPGSPRKGTKLSEIVSSSIDGEE
ncbi:hypothetical protein C8J56DRAFT_937785 [Mycena floridula]|nr:hypothetical protein C8J56DRAFT_937785 [Mycena floridula]